MRACLSVVVALALSVLGCSLTRSAAPVTPGGTVIRDAVFLARPIGTAYEIVDLDGRTLDRLHTPGRKWVSSVAPDHVGYAWVEVMPPSGSGMGRIQLWVSTGDGAGTLVTEDSWEGTADPDVISIQWLSANAQTFAARINGVLSIWKQCVKGWHRERLETHVGPFAVVSKGTVVMVIGEPRRVVVRSITAGPSAAADRELRIERPDVLFPASEDSVVAAWRQGDGVLARFAVVRLQDGVTAPVALPSNLRPLHVVAINGTDTFLVENQSGRERIDGSAIASLELWDYRTGDVRTLMDDSGMLRAYETAKNVQVVEFACPTEP